MSNDPTMLEHLAPGLGASDLMRLGYIRRWGIVSTIREQDVASHSARVALLAMFVINKIVGLGVLRRDAHRYFMSYVMPTAMAMAVVHDVPEVFTGDIPAPYKKWMAKEVDPLAEPFDLTRMFGSGDEDTSAPGPIALAFVHWADTVEASAFLYDNCHTPHGKAVADQIDTSEASRQLIKRLYAGGWVDEEAGTEFVHPHLILHNELSNIVSKLRMAGTTDIGRSGWGAQ